MEGRGLSKTLENLTLGSITLSAGEREGESATASISSANPRPKSPLKSPSKMAARASPKPYDVPLPTALGPGGLVSMLKSLRQIRDVNVEREAMAKKLLATTAVKTKDTVKNTTMFEDTFVTCQGDKRDDNNNLATREEARTHEAFTTATDLEKRIIRQVEHYFGDYNLPKDKWMLEKMEECDDGWFDMETMMTFKRLRSLTQDPSVVLTALAKSPQDLMQIENWGHGKGRVRRNPVYPIPEVTEARRISLQERTLFVWGFDKTTSLDELIEYFENNFRNVVNIRQRTMLTKNREPAEESGEQSEKVEPQRHFMGSLFLTFATRQDAEDFYKNRRQSLSFKDRKLQTKWQKDFFNAKTVFNDEYDETTVLRTVYVSGFDNKDTTKEELVQFFKRFQGPVALRKRVYRFDASDGAWQFTGAVFVSFDTPENAKKFLNMFSEQNLIYNDSDVLRVKWQGEFYEEKGLFKQELASLHH